jgi:squalene-associated FAD-dependent desaturase
MSRVVIAGAGLAGLVAAEAASAAGREVVILEASPKAGGRCRSYRDERLGRLIDNGNHLILTANRAVLDWAARIGGSGALEAQAEASFPFLDLGSDERWHVRIGADPRAALPPGAPIRAAVRDAVRLLRARRGATVADALGARDALWERFWDPMTRAVLNADPTAADARLLRTALLRSFARGARACRPVLAPGGLGPALIDPALEVLARRGVSLRLRTPVRGVEVAGDRVTALDLGDERITLGAGDALILALPPQAVADLLPGQSVPGPGPSIANAHFLVPRSGLPPVLGTLGSAAQWIFRRGDVVSVTVSAAEASPLAGLGRDAALALLWSEVVRAVAAHGGGAVPAEMPPARLLRERAATFDQSPAGAARRPGPRTLLANLYLAGDYTATGLPATLEGAVLSGERAAACALGRPAPRRRARASAAPAPA